MTAFTQMHGHQVGGLVSYCHSGLDLVTATVGLFFLTFISAFKKEGIRIRNIRKAKLSKSRIFLISLTSWKLFKRKLETRQNTRARGKKET